MWSDKSYPGGGHRRRSQLYLFIIIREKSKRICSLHHKENKKTLATVAAFMQQLQRVVVSTKENDGFYVLYLTKWNKAKDCPTVPPNAMLTLNQRCDSIRRSVLYHNITSSARRNHPIMILLTFFYCPSKLLQVPRSVNYIGSNE